MQSQDYQSIAACRGPASPGDRPEPPRDARPPAYAPHEAQILMFPREPAPRNRLTMRDRMEVLRWTEQTARHGFTRIVFDTASECSGHEPGDYLLVYERDALWASWGIGCADGRLTLWNAATGVTIGSYTTMAESLAAIEQAVTLV
jgi:hypothetical protein